MLASEPMATPDIAPITIPDGFTVWAGSDWHGQRAAADRLLARAGLTDGADRWIAPPGTALVITGDLVDRGPDSVGLVRRIASLREQAPALGSLVAILEGNHEIQVLGGLDGVPEIFEALMTFGGGATMLSAGMPMGAWEDRPAEELAAYLDTAVPDLRPTLRTFAPYARWRDTLFVHGGPVPDRDLEHFRASSERLWIRRRFFESPDSFPEADCWSAYREAGFRRIVFGHTPLERATTFHDGLALCLDTWRGGIVTLARIPAEGSLEAAEILEETAEPRAVADRPVDPDRLRRLDGPITEFVDAWAAKGRTGVVGARPDDRP